MKQRLHFMLIMVAAICIGCNGGEVDVQIVGYKISDEHIIMLTDTKLKLTAKDDSLLAIYEVISTHTPSGEVVDNHVYGQQVTFTLKDSILKQYSSSEAWNYKLSAVTDLNIHKKSYQVKEFDRLEECDDCDIILYWSDSYGVLQIHDRSWNSRQTFNHEDAVVSWLNALIKN